MESKDVPSNKDAILSSKLQKVLLSDGGNLERALYEQRKVMERTKTSQKPLFIFDIVVPNRSKFDELLELISEYYGVKEKTIKDMNSYPGDQYREMREMLSAAHGLNIIRDLHIHKFAPFAGWLHSQDQGFQEPNHLREIASKN